MLVLCVSFAIALLDQWTKNLIRASIPYGGYEPVIPGFFDLRYIQNTGAAWGMLEGLNHWLVIFSIVMLVAVVRYRRHLMDHRVISRTAVGLILGGITGNLIDRVRLSYVVDFLHFHAYGHQFPAFNVADAAICTGVGLYLLSQWLPVKKQGDAEATATSAEPTAPDAPVADR
jgi:signal peptidase II